jgi:hypothetical protein
MPGSEFIIAAIDFVRQRGEVDFLFHGMYALMSWPLIP